MQYDLGPVTLALPDAFEDRSAYRYEDAARTLALEVSRRTVTPGTSPRDVAHSALDNVRAGYPGAVTVVADAPMTLLGCPAWGLSFALAVPREEPIGFHHAVCVWSHLALRIALKERGLRPDRAVHPLAHVLASAEWSANAAPRAGAPGYVRRQAGLVTLDVPEVLAPPTVFQMALADRSVRVDVSLVQETIAMHPGDIDTLIPEMRPDRALVVPHAAQRPCAVAQCEGYEGAWEAQLRGAHGEILGEYSVRSLRLQLGENIGVWLTAVGADAGRGVLHGVWPAIVSSVRRSAQETTHG